MSKRAVAQSDRASLNSQPNTSCGFGSDGSGELHSEGRGFESLPARPNPANIDKKRMKNFGVRWAESLGRKECPYMKRWILNLWLFSIRVHVWYRSDDKRYQHNHAFNFLTIVLKGHYTDVSGNKSDFMSTGSIRYRKANHTHFVGWPKPKTVTLLFCGRKKQNWGFFVEGKFIRPLRFFSRYGHPECTES